jgi:hypothetical protein
VRIHLAREHARELELAHALLESGDVAIDVGEARLVLFGLDQREQFSGIGKSGADLVEFRDGCVEPGALAPERLRLRR